jgi:transcriptional regulator with XRE-family HTH domain
MTRLIKDFGAHPVDIHVGMRLRHRRRLLGMSQVLLSERVGVTFQQIQKYERGARITSSRLYEFASALDIPIGYFFEGLPDTDSGRSGPDRLVVTSVSAAERFAKSWQGVEIADLFTLLPASSHRRIVRIVREIAGVAEDVSPSSGPSILRSGIAEAGRRSL